MSVLSVPEMLGSGDDQGGGEDGQSQGQERTTSVKTKKSARSVSVTSGVSDNGSGEGPCGHQPGHLQDGLL